MSLGSHESTNGTFEGRGKFCKHYKGLVTAMYNYLALQLPGMVYEEISRERGTRNPSKTSSAPDYYLVRPHSLF